MDNENLNTSIPVETNGFTNPKRTINPLWWFLAALIDLFIIAALVVYWQTTPSPDFKSATFFIEPGSTVSDIADKLATENIIRNNDLFYVLILLKHPDANIKAGNYYFTEPLNLFETAEHIINNIPQEDLVTLTFPEGTTLKSYAATAAVVLPDFDTEEFLTLTENLEGFLWPETYFVPTSYTAADLSELLQTEYTTNRTELAELFTASNLPEREVITLASIVEREANSEVSMKMVAGILQNRLEIGMPLQADATIEYVLEDPLNELKPGELAQNLREIDSPYNTYKHNQLPPTPIGNPGLTAIKAVLEPTPSDYFYYITGTDGKFYYAKTLQQHNQNISRYLR